MDKIAVFGLGLIGGSMALELKKSSWATIYGIDKNPEHVKTAIERGIIFEAADYDILDKVDLVILAVPVDVLPELAIKVLDRIEDKTIVLDVGSTKAAVCQAISTHPKRGNFVAAHPIAGTEYSGPTAAIYDLFAEKVNIICEREKSSPQALELVAQIFRDLKMKTVFMDSPEQHDRHIAYVSHLSHISSFMLGKTVLEIEKDEKNIFNMAGSGFASTVRLAKSNPLTWTPIMRQNKTHLLRSLDEYIKNLNEFKQILESDSREDLLQIMKDTNKIKSVLEGIKNQ